MASTWPIEKKFLREHMQECKIRKELIMRTFIILYCIWYREVQSLKGTVSQDVPQAHFMRGSHLGDHVPFLDTSMQVFSAEICIL